MRQMSLEFSQSAWSPLEYLSQGLVNACFRRPVEVRQTTGFTFWDAGAGKSGAGVLIWQTGDLKVSIWLLGQDVQPLEEDPHPFDDLLLLLAESMQPAGNP